MAKACAKIVVQVHKRTGWYELYIVSDFGTARVLGGRDSLSVMTRRARQWSRRLGDIPVEVDK